LSDLQEGCRDSSHHEEIEEDAHTQQRRDSDRDHKEVVRQPQRLQKANRSIFLQRNRMRARNGKKLTFEAVYPVKAANN
jgi:hypothetical protein